MKRRLRAIDVTAGAGGWAVAARGLPIDVVVAIDIWEPAAMTYKINHPGTCVIRGDCTRMPIAPGEVKGAFDLVLGGIPCQWLTVYRGEGLGNKTKAPEVEKERALLDSILDWIKIVDPRYWCLEDVAGLIRELPPLTPYTVIDAQEFCGQRRKRVYVGRFPAPAKQTDPRTLADYLLPGPYRIGRRTWDRTAGLSQTHRKESCLAAIPDRKAPTVMAVSSRHDGDVAVVDDRLPRGKRQYEWQEGARLQGFPTDYLFWGSPTDVAQMVGNAVQIDTGRAILKSICQHAGLRKGDAQ